MAYPNPLSDVPKTNGSHVQLPPNQCENNEDVTWALSLTPETPKLLRPKQSPRLFRALRAAIIIAATVLLGSMAVKGAQQTWNLSMEVERKIKPPPTESFGDRMERRQQEAREAQP